MSSARARTRACLLLAALSCSLACAEKSEPEQKKAVAPTKPAKPAPPPVVTVQPLLWSYSSKFSTWLPVPKARVGDVRRQGKRAATLDGRLVLLDVRRRRGRAQLAQVSGPITFVIGTLRDATLRARLMKLSRTHRVGLTFRRPYDPRMGIKTSVYESGVHPPAPRKVPIDLHGVNELVKLQMVDVRNAGGVTDAEVARLAKLTSLRVADLRGAESTDASLPRKTRLSSEAIDKLRRALPKCKVHR